MSIKKYILGILRNQRDRERQGKTGRNRKTRGKQGEIKKDWER